MQRKTDVNVNSYNIFLVVHTGLLLVPGGEKIDEIVNLTLECRRTEVPVDWAMFRRCLRSATIW